MGLVWVIATDRSLRRRGLNKQTRQERNKGQRGKKIGGNGGWGSSHLLADPAHGHGRLNMGISWDHGDPRMGRHGENLRQDKASWSRLPDLRRSNTRVGAAIGWGEKSLSQMPTPRLQQDPRHETAAEADGPLSGVWRFGGPLAVVEWPVHGVFGGIFVRCGNVPRLS